MESEIKRDERKRDVNQLPSPALKTKPGGKEAKAARSTGRC